MVFSQSERKGGAIIELLCGKCKGRAQLHVGDRVAFGGNKTFFSHAHLILKARLLGVIVNDIGKNTKFYIYNPGPSKESDLKQPRAAKIKVITPSTFEKYLDSLCRGNVLQKKNPPFKNIIEEGAALYGIGLTKLESAKLHKFAQENGCRVFKVRKQSIAAAISNHKHLDSGDADIFRAWEFLSTTSQS